MSRYSGPFPGYDPGLELSTREQPEGGDVSHAVIARFKNNAARSQAELLLVIHGFNNSASEAQEAYTHFRSRKIADYGGSASRFVDGMGDFFWPGDVDWPGPLDLFDSLFYPHAIPNALTAVPVLAAYLRGRSDVRVLHIVGHSMGCRVALELIKALGDTAATHRGPAIGKVCLMAPAVPTFKVGPGGDLARAIAMPKEVLILYSPADTVLHYAFPPGQTLADGDEGCFPEAVGLHGFVPGRPNITTQEISHAEHSDYWGGNQNDPSAASCAATSEFLSDATKARQLPARNTAAVAASAARVIASARNLAARS